MWAAWAAEYAASTAGEVEDPIAQAAESVARCSRYAGHEPADTDAQAALLREVFGNPFRPVTGDPAWLTPAVTALARAAYHERDLPSGELDRGLLAILADALEEAGCASADLQAHLRGPGPHVRGCWAVDLVLARE